MLRVVRPEAGEDEAFSIGHGPDRVFSEWCDRHLVNRIGNILTITEEQVACYQRFRCFVIVFMHQMRKIKEIPIKMNKPISRNISRIETSNIFRIMVIVNEKINIDSMNRMIRERSGTIVLYIPWQLPIATNFIRLPVINIERSFLRSPFFITEIVIFGWNISYWVFLTLYFFWISFLTNDADP